MTLPQYSTVTLIHLLSSLLVDRVIQKKRRDYSDPNSSANMKKINDDLQSIHNVMNKTIYDVLDRYYYYVLCGNYYIRSHRVVCCSLTHVRTYL